MDPQRLLCFGLNCTENYSRVILLQRSEVIPGNVPIRVCEVHLHQIQPQVKFVLKVISATWRLLGRNPANILSENETSGMEDHGKKFIYTLFSIINQEIGNLFMSMNPERVFADNFNHIHRLQSILVINMIALADSYGETAQQAAQSLPCGHFSRRLVRTLTFMNDFHTDQMSYRQFMNFTLEVNVRNRIRLDVKY